MTATRWPAIGGMVGPAAFIGAWVTGAFLSDDLSPVDDAISRLAAVGADTQSLMTAGFVIFGAALPFYAASLRARVPGAAWVSAAATGLCTLGVALTPLDGSSMIDKAHAVFAGLGYATLAATPLLAARPLSRIGRRGLARSGVIAGTVSGASLLLSLTGLPAGLFQRIGLTASDAWIMASALAIASGRLRPRDTDGLLDAAQLDAQ